MVLTVFRSRLRPDVKDYPELATRMSELAKKMPGYISHKGFVAEDGERVTLVEFESEQAQRAWRMHPEHAEAQKLGRQAFYSEFRLQICSVQRETVFPPRAK
ncbi:MAG: antibiotic biosynthesis monooxygenase [Betaproteobacteria bacterium]|nr:MAG: antibiotic biosynthesis monooxygenase [Betaproteobacteria bacterium]